MKRNGNRLPEAAPHGVFQCQGDDSWVAISIVNEEQWHGFSRAIGSPSWAEQDKFSSLNRRKENEDELERLITTWTLNNTVEHIEEILQKTIKNCFLEKKLKETVLSDYVIEIPNTREHGHFATNIPLSLASSQRRPPMEIAEIIINNLKNDQDLFSSNFINNNGLSHLAGRLSRGLLPPIHHSVSFQQVTQIAPGLVPDSGRESPETKSYHCTVIF